MLFVDTECYGICYIPEGLWFCQKCQVLNNGGENEQISCVFCPNSGGALKRTKDGRWAHVICALWIPETSFTLTDDGMRGEIDNIDKIPKARWKLNCELCKQKEGGIESI
jgi:hypothetical protein